MGERTRLTQKPEGPSASPVALRMGYIDGLRALAALWVAFHHVIETSIPTKALHTPVLAPVLASLAFGQFPVMVFLMLSGFCLYYPYVRKNPAAPQFSGFGTYLLRRWRRIAPPYLCAGAFCLLLSLWPSLLIGKWQQTMPIDGKVVLSHLLFGHNLIPSHAFKIDYPMWSIALEWQLYLLFPLMIWAFRTVGARLTLTATLLLAVAIRASYTHVAPGLGAVLRDGPFSYLEIFAAGMLAAVLTVQGRKLLPTWALALIAAVGLAAVRLGSGNGLVHDLATTAAFFCVLQMAADPSTRVSRLLSAPWLVRIGLFSYSLYLVHAPLVHLAWYALRYTSLSPDAIFVTLAIAGIPLIVLLSYLFHLVFERPFMRIAPASVPVPLARVQV